MNQERSVMIRMNNNKPVEDKEVIREQLEKDIELYLSCGGKINKYPTIHYTVAELQKEANFKNRVRKGL